MVFKFKFRFKFMNFLSLSRQKFMNCSSLSKFLVRGFSLFSFSSWAFCTPGLGSDTQALYSRFRFRYSRSLLQVQVQIHMLSTPGSGSVQAFCTPGLGSDTQALHSRFRFRYTCSLLNRFRFRSKISAVYSRSRLKDT